jgi:hypothetical protein
MPAVNPRIQVTLKPSLHAVIKRLSEATGNSMSSLVSEFLEPNEAVFERMVLIIEAAASARDEVKEKIARNMDEVQSQIESKLGLTLDLFEASTEDLLKEVETVGRRRRPPARSAQAREAGRRSAKPTAAPSLTGGSGTPQKGAKKAPKVTSKARQVRRSGQHG